MTGLGARLARRAGFALVLSVLAVPLSAQDTFSLPPGTASPTARPAGPVDPDNPVIAPRARPTQTAAPQPAATAPSTTPATVQPSPVVTRAPARTGALPTARPTSAAPQPGPAVAPAASPGAAATDSLALPGNAATPVGSPFPTALPTARSAPEAAPRLSGSDSALPAWWPYGAAGLAALLVLIGGGLFWRRRRGAAELPIDFEPPVVAAPRAQAEPIALPTPKESPVEAAPKPVTEGLTITLEARRLDASLVATTLAYSLRVTNNSAAPLMALAIEADMVAAHSTLPVGKQIANTDLRLEPRHALVELAAGESTEFRGEMRLPLTAITPIRSGGAAYFVPLARLRVEAAQNATDSLVLAQTFVIGELPEKPGGALRPFRLDLGPRTFSRLGQRTVG